MIFMVYDSKVSVATLVFYTCIYFPFLQAKRLLLDIFSFFLCVEGWPLKSLGSDQRSSKEVASASCSIDLSMERYGDLKNKISRCGGCDLDETCSVCLVEFEGEDYVTKLPKCGHVYHMSCIEGWVERNQFTCPLCRSIFFSALGVKLP